MTIPSYEKIMLPLLQFLNDKTEHSFHEAIEYMSKEFNLSTSEREQLKHSGGLLFNDKVGWAKAYLCKAGLIEGTKRGYFRITEIGTGVLQENPLEIDKRYLEKFPEFVKFKDAIKNAKPIETANNALSPTVETKENRSITYTSLINSAIDYDLMTANLSTKSEICPNLQYPNLASFLQETWKLSNIASTNRKLSSSFFGKSIFNSLFPEEYELLPYTHEVFALEFARGEIEALSTEELVNRSGFFARIGEQPTLHFRMCQKTPIDEMKSGKTVWVKSFFEANRYSTGYATHSLFPYRGKFHPQLIKGILNVINVKKGEMVLDPMAGSGTACIEAQLMGMNSICIDINPFCTLIARAKSYALDIDSAKLEHLDENSVLNISKKLGSIKLSKNTDIQTYFSENPITGDDRVDSIIFLSYLDAIGYSRRRKTGTISTLFPKVLNRYIKTIVNFENIRQELALEFGRLEALTENVLNLPMPNEAVDAIVTSPPYSFAIDYVENDKPQLEVLGIDTNELKKKTIGLQGMSKEEKIKNYFANMKIAMSEMSRVLKVGGFCVIIVGSNTIQTDGIKIEKEFCTFAQMNKMKLERDVIKSIQGIQNSMREEHVLFFQKQ